VCPAHVSQAEANGKKSTKQQESAPEPPPAPEAPAPVAHVVDEKAEVKPYARCAEQCVKTLSGAGMQGCLSRCQEQMKELKAAAVTPKTKQERKALVAAAKLATQVAVAQGEVDDATAKLNRQRDKQVRASADHALCVIASGSRCEREPLSRQRASKTDDGTVLSWAPYRLILLETVALPLHPPGKALALPARARRSTSSSLIDAPGYGHAKTLVKARCEAEAEHWAGAGGVTRIHPRGWRRCQAKTLAKQSCIRGCRGLLGAKLTACEMQCSHAQDPRKPTAPQQWHPKAAARDRFSDADAPVAESEVRDCVTQ
jgi:hypothetical protein